MEREEEEAERERERPIPRSLASFLQGRVRNNIFMFIADLPTKY